MKKETIESILFHAIGIGAIVGLFFITFLAFGCKKPTTITWKLAKGSSDVFVQEGYLVTDFQQCPEGWTHTREAKHTTYSIHAKGTVQIYRNNCLVAHGVDYAQFRNP